MNSGGGEYKLIYPGLNAQEDVFYYTKQDGGIDYSTDFITLVQKHKNEITRDIEARNFYIKTGLFLPGKTFFKEIHRVKIGCALCISENDWEEVRLPLERKEFQTYITQDIFKTGLLETIKLYAPCEEEYLLFSGGRDSSLLSLLLHHELGADFNCVMALSKGAEIFDDLNAKIDFYSKHLKKQIITISVDQDDYTFDKIRYLVKNMPLTAHNSIGFDAMCRYVNEKGGRCWTGQDADSMYSLGYTGGDFREILCRMMISDWYLKSLSNVKGISLGKVLSDIFAFISNSKSHGNLRSPRNLNEFRDAFLHMYASVPLIHKNKVIPSDIANLTLDQAKLMLYLDKMGFYIVGRDHRIITYAGHLKRKTVYPYSSAMMFFICSRIRRGFSEIITNKRYISNLVKYYIGNKAFKKLYPSEFFRSYKASEKYETNILDNTTFGKSLKQESGYNGNKFQEALAFAWESELLKEIDI